MTNAINDNDLSQVTGGMKYANGKYEDYGNYIVYIVAPGDVLSGIGARFGVPYAKIAEWNNIKNPDVISVGQRLVIYTNVRN